MKKLSTEEKAERFDKAYKIAEGIHRFSSNPAEIKRMEEIFPALKEDEDERIRGAIIDHLKDNNLTGWAVWLEKQGEQKVEVKYVYTKFRIGDVIVEIKPNGYCQPVTVKYVGEGAYSCESDDGKRSLSFPIISQDEYKLVEQKPAIEMKNPKESLGVDSDTYNKIVDDAWSEDDEINYIYVLSACRHYAEENGYADTETHKAINNWLKSLKERVQSQPKREWSEEDEKKRSLLISILEVNYPNGYFKVNPAYTLNMEAMSTEELVEWLKSLKDRLPEKSIK